MTDIAQPSSLRVRATHAVAMFTILSVGARVVMLVSNWLLGYFLDQEAFGVMGMVGIVTTLAWTFVGFGLDDVLIQRGRSIRLWESTTFAASLTVGILAGLSVALSAPFFGWIFREPGLVGPLMAMSLCMPIASLSTVASAKISSEMDFPFFVRWSVVELLVGQILTVILALLHFGAYSFVLPVILVMVLRAVAYNLRARPNWGIIQRGKRRLLILRKGAMVAGGKVAGGLVTQADYLVLALLTNTTALGYYFFAFRIAALPVRTIAGSLGQVLFPAMSSHRGDIARQSASAIKAAALLCWVVSPLCYLQMAVARPLLELFFGDKWALSIPVIEFLSAGLAIEAVMTVMRSFLSAAGKFHVGLTYSILHGIGYSCACLIGALWGSINGLALAVSLYYIITQPIIFVWLVDQSRQKIRMLIDIFVLPSLVSAASFGAGLAVSKSAFVPQGYVWEMAITALVGGAAFIGMLAFTAPAIFRELVDLGRSFLRRRRPIQASA
ncbi:MAG: oligosaccharide flippase family protein [Caulobacterales bacterium]